jgi:Co/Zn/Cd efflux system component
MHRHSAHSGFHFHILTDLVKNLILPLLALAILLGGSPAIDAWAGYAIGWLIIVRALLLALESIFGKKVTERVFHYLLDTVAR